MKRRQSILRVLVFQVAFVTALGLGVVASMAVAELTEGGPKANTGTGFPLGNSDLKLVEEPPALPPFNPWIADTGNFAVPAWDDRNLPEGADREPDPRWPAFAECMEFRGHRDVRGNDGAFTDLDMEKLLAGLNEANPDGRDNKLRPSDSFTGGRERFPGLRQ